MTTLRELVTVFGFEPDEDGLATIEGTIDGLKTGFLAVATAAAAGAATMFGIASSVAQFGDDAFKAAERLGLTTESLQQLDFALRISGTSMDEQRGSLVRLARQALDASNGVAESVEVFDALGVSVMGAGGELKSTEELLLDVSEAFAAMPNGIEKTGLAADLLGRRGTSMIQFLNLGADGARELMQEASALGGVLSNEAADSGQVFNDTILRLKTALNGLRLQLGTALIPVITETVQQVLDFVNANRELLGQRLEEFFRNVTALVRGVSRAMFAMVRVVDITVQALGGLEGIVAKLTFALTVLGVNTIRTVVIPALVTLLSSATAAGVGIALAAAKTWLWNAALAAIPLAISAVIVLVGVMIDDFRRFASGQDSLIGRLLAKYGQLEGGIGGMFASMLGWLEDLRDFGGSTFRNLAMMARQDTERIAGFFRRMALRVQLIFHDLREGTRDVMDVLGRLPGMGDLRRGAVEESRDEGARSALQQQLQQEQSSARDALARNTQERMLFAEQEARRVQDRRAAPDRFGPVDASSMTEVQVNITGGDPDVIRENVEAAIQNANEQRERGLLRVLGVGANLSSAGVP